LVAARDTDLIADADGGYTVTFSAARPADVANWLELKAGSFCVVAHR
jgi:hypothetical protein